MDIHEDESFNNINKTELKTDNSEFEACEFINCDFSEANFKSSKLIDCTFSNCNLSMAKLNNLQLNNVSFKSCKLLGINFSECQDFLFSAKFEDCLLDYAVFIKKKMPKTSFIKSSMKNANFTEADLTKSIFSDSDLLNCIFDHTTLKEADFVTAQNYNIDPDLNIIKKAKFSVHGLAGLLVKYDIVIK